MGKLKECKSCNYSTSDYSNWARHLRSQKHLKKLGKTFTCSKCDKKFTRSDNRKRHEQNCKAVKKSDIDILEEIEKLKESITNIQTPVIQNNKDLDPLTEEIITKHIRHLRLDYIQEGGKGYAEFGSIYALKDNIILLDKSRKKIKYNDPEQGIVVDFGGVKLSKLFFKNICQRNAIIINQEYKRLQEEVYKIAQDNKAGDHDVSKILQKSINLQNILDQCINAANGDQNELTEEFIRHLVRKI